MCNTYNKLNSVLFWKCTADPLRRRRIIPGDRRQYFITLECVINSCRQQIICEIYESSSLKTVVDNRSSARSMNQHYQRQLSTTDHQRDLWIIITKDYTHSVRKEFHEDMYFESSLIDVKWATRLFEWNINFTQKFVYLLYPVVIISHVIVTSSVTMQSI